MTAARVRGSKRVRSNSQRGRDRLEGLIPVVEDWHAKGCLLTVSMIHAPLLAHIYNFVAHDIQLVTVVYTICCFLQVIWKRLYKCSSTMDRGTLYHLRNVINRRNVVNEPTKAVDACEEFFLVVVEAHIQSAAMAMFGMSATEGAPTNRQHFPLGAEKLAPSERKQILLMAAGALVDKYVDLSLPGHGSKKPVKSAERDGVLEYATDVLTLGLLLMEFNDAIREGDGNRICRCWQFFLPIFKATKRKNYAIEAFVLLAQLHFLFTPRMAAQLKWSRTINTHGRPGKNIPCDLHMEHLNRLCKSSLTNLGANISDKAVLRVGKCLGEMTKIVDSYDSENGVPHQSGKHAPKSEKIDRDKILEQLNDIQVFTPTPGRKHRTFYNFRANPVRKLSSTKLKKWMEKQLAKIN